MTERCFFFGGASSHSPPPPPPLLLLLLRGVSSQAIAAATGGGGKKEEDPIPDPLELQESHRQLSFFSCTRTLRYDSVEMQCKLLHPALP